MPRVLFLTSLLLMAACGGEGGGGEAPAGSGGPRIAVMAPSGAEMLAAFGMLEHAVAAGDFVDWPPAAARLPRIGAYDAPNLEMLLALDTDLMVTTCSEAARRVHDRIRALGIRVVALRTDTWEHTLEAFAVLGEELGLPERADALTSTLRARMEAVRERTRGLPARSTLVVVGRSPLYAAGPGSHLDELIRAGGGRNILTGGPPYQLVSMEAVLEDLPEVIIDTSQSRGPRGDAGGRGGWGRWPFLPAVQEDRVWQVHPERVAIPGPRVPRMAELVARMIHPEVFSAPAPGELGPLSPADTTGLEVIRAP